MTTGTHRAPAVPRAERGRHRAKTADQLLAEYRWWAMACVALTVYVLLVLPVEYYGRGMRDPWFVFPAIGVLLVWWGVITKMLHTWDRHVTTLRRARRAATAVTR
ncbi:hypothetical protein SAMN04489727_1748 [Amycolatopsis tolypomycina]|uniref:2TM domain-containing protein n=1 Tax=Amycolatopsis tolypomycina TaxID=208445 RepID=A0A1H4JE52_9PSEU|nr:hypothetical protein [Amycolatopsis tolypomycina]SEB43852.1 hypothetical protein SAMN04489727_1748 [Amycolatopsis tolypomycina]